MNKFNLMVGNYIYKDNKIEKIFGIYIGDIVLIGGENYNLDDIYPIEITPNILENFGFEKDMDFLNKWNDIQVYVYYTYNTPFIRILHDLNNDKFWIVSELEKYEVKYFHEIQNYVNIIKKIGYNLFKPRSLK